FNHFLFINLLFFFSSRRRHTRSKRDWSSDVCSSDLTLTLEGEDLWVYEPEKRYYWQLDELALQSTIRELRQHLELEDDPSIHNQIGRASCRERVERAEVGVAAKKTTRGEGTGV